MDLLHLGDGTRGRWLEIEHGVIGTVVIALVLGPIVEVRFIHHMQFVVRPPDSVGSETVGFGRNLDALEVGFENLDHEIPILAGHVIELSGRTVVEGTALAPAEFDVEGDGVRALFAVGCEFDEADHAIRQIEPGLAALPWDFPAPGAGESLGKRVVRAERGEVAADGDRDALLGNRAGIHRKRVDAINGGAEGPLPVLWRLGEGEADVGVLADKLIGHPSIHRRGIQIVIHPRALDVPVIERIAVGHGDLGFQIGLVQQRVLHRRLGGFVEMVRSGQQVVVGVSGEVIHDAVGAPASRSIP